MSEQIIKTIKDIDKNNILESIEDKLSDTLGLKELRAEINQDIICRLKLLNYKPNTILGLGILDGSFSVYKLGLLDNVYITFPCH